MKGTVTGKTHVWPQIHGCFRFQCSISKHFQEQKETHSHGDERMMSGRCITALQKVDTAEWAHPVHVVPVDTPAHQGEMMSC